MAWNKVEDKLVKEFSFADFKEAIAFIIKIGMIAEKKDHHPDILLHSYNKVRVILTTHSKGKVTAKDIELSKEIDKIK